MKRSQPSGPRRRRPSPLRDPVLIALAFLAFALSAAWAFSTPVPVSPEVAAVWGNFYPDESVHIAVIDYVVQHHASPPYEEAYATAAHPPLYHSLVAPLADALATPVLGREGAGRLLRLLSALMGAGVVVFVYCAGDAVAGRRTARIAAALVALIPMRVALGGAITNENLAALGAAGSCAYLAGGLRRGFDRRTTLLLAFWTLVGIGSKVTCLGLLPAAAVALGGEAYRGRLSWQGAWGRFAVIVGVTAMGTGWWFIQNVVVYGDPFRAAAVNRVWDPIQVGAATIMARKHWHSWRYLVSILTNGYLSFWGVFDGMNRRMPWKVYDFLALCQGVCLIGGGMLWRRSPRRVRAWLPLIGAWAIFAAWTYLVYIQYNWRHYTPQGRYFFVLLAPFGVLFALGWQSLFRRAALRRAASIVVFALLLLLNLWVLWMMPRRLVGVAAEIRPHPLPLSRFAGRGESEIGSLVSSAAVTDTVCQTVLAILPPQAGTSPNFRRPSPSEAGEAGTRLRVVG